VKTAGFFVVLCVGMLTAFFFGYTFNAGIRPPANQDQRFIPVTLVPGQGNDWLVGTRAYLVPLPGIQSPRTYSVLVLAPPAVSKSTPSAPPMEMYLTGQKKGLVQPISISPKDFGNSGSNIVVKLFDNPSITPLWNSGDKLTLSSVEP
jgi:hypothetical protein